MKVIGYRVSAGKSRKECAELIGKSVNAYTLKEKGKSCFTIDEAWALSKFLDCPLAVFLKTA